MKQHILLLLALVGGWGIQAQQASCSYTGESESVVDHSFKQVPMDDEKVRVQAVVRKIMDEAGLAPKFLVQSGYVANAMAVIKDKQRYILYSPYFIKYLEAQTGTKWALYAVLAHEVAHHLNGHTVEEIGSRPDLELECDQYAGKILCGLGATLSEAQAIMQLVGEHGSDTHPPRQQREEAIAQGWNKNCTTDLPDFVTMKRVEGGTFTMGDMFGEGESNETQHQVTLRTYWLGATEVTQDEWVSIMGSNPSYFKCGSCPVEQVSWNDVQEFLQKLNTRYPNRNYRLPTEAEWEYAARERGQKVRFGNGKNTLDPSQANFDASESNKKPYSVAGEYRSKTTAVNTFSPNSLGLYDMAGNVWEWCSDWYGTYPSTAQTNPIGAESGSNRVVRGGSWYFYPQYLRCAYRGGDSPDSRHYSVGFRLSRTE